MQASGMKLILSLGLRNLLRQKRRSFFLGIAIAFGMMILIMANSFSHGITDNLLNKMVVYMTGHMSVSMMEESSQNRRIIRDRDRIRRVIRENVGDIKSVDEAVATFARLIGNARGDNTIVVGVEIDPEFGEYLGQNIIKGSLKDFTSGGLENPVIVYSDKAKLLGVTVRDTINMRTRTLTGQAQTARLTVAAILRTNNIFEGMAIYMPLKTLKTMIGLRPWETGELHINFKHISDERAAKREADKLYAKLRPDIAIIAGTASRKKTATAAAAAFGLSRSSEAGAVMKKNISIVKGAAPEETSEDGALVGRELADRLGVGPGDSFTFSYDNRFDAARTELEYTVSGVYTSAAIPDGSVILLSEKAFYKTYLQNLPKDPAAGAFRPARGSALYALFAPEWKLLSRTFTNDDLKIKLANMTRTKWRGPWLDVRTMYETADFILKFEFALFVVALIAVLILFFIILIGVLNTLRMTIRERTREIGTIRAIGMQKSDVRHLFIIETVLLTAFACIGGIIGAFVLMWTLGMVHIETDSLLSILLVDRHLYFLPTVSMVAFYFFLILAMAAVTAYFPARRAAEMSAVEALRHFE
jgi:ABC-type lipoprotein release transport system permease subunit